jgi:hypothetical protein
MQSFTVRARSVRRHAGQVPVHLVAPVPLVFFYIMSLSLHPLYLCVGSHINSLPELGRPLRAQCGAKPASGPAGRASLCTFRHGPGCNFGFRIPDRLGPGETGAWAPTGTRGPSACGDSACKRGSRMARTHTRGRHTDASTDGVAGPRGAAKTSGSPIIKEYIRNAQTLGKIYGFEPGSPVLLSASSLPTAWQITMTRK